MQLAPGDVFAGYTIISALGTGGMGEVYLARHPRLPRRDALKILPVGISTDPTFRERFTREADLASGLWHPNVVSVYDRGEYSGQLWIAMEFVDGTDAGRHLAGTHPAGMAVEEVVAIVNAVAAALDHAHKRGLLHRDVKPANIMLAQQDDASDDDRRILLADFGIARPLNEVSGLTTTNMTVGTVAYAAPEQLMGEDIDGRADQYALAATAYHLLAGEQLFPQSNPAVVISRHLNADPPSLATRRRELAALDPVLARALSKNPADRYASCTDFARALSAAVSMDARAASAPTATAPRAAKSAGDSPKTHGEVVPRPNTAQRWWAAGSIAGVVVLLVALLLVWRPWQRADVSGPTAAPTTAAPATRSTAPTSPLMSATSPSPTTATTNPVSMPAYPPANSGCQGTVTGHHDIDHKTLGPLRIFLTLSPAGAGSDACIAAVTASGAALPPIMLDARESVGFANPATDSTGNTFITYNPGRYNGVLVLIPTAGGFEDVGWDDTGGGTQHYYGQHAYYNAELLGPGPDGRCTIRQYHHSCTPSCAEGTTTTEDLHWNGSDYVA